jgi:HSP20 family protein
MAIVRWNPFISPISRWSNFWDEEDLSELTTTASNNLDVYETAEEVVVKANVAGVSADKIDVTFEKGMLYITAQVEEEQGSDDKKTYTRSSWRYSYRVAVPGMLDQNSEPTAEVEDGIITLRFKKAEQSKPKKLQVKSNKQTL